jgi:peptidoglycan/LPS O-acetylase OafA/YrhL
MTSGMQRVRALDGVRGWAILWVLLYHLYALVPKAPGLACIPGLVGLAGYGWIGVSLFFALSGYLIIPLLAEQKGRPHYFGRFWCRRVFRLLPVYGLFLLSFLVARTCWPEPGLARERLFDPGIPLWSYGLLAQNILMSAQGYMGNEWLRVSWSLAVEVQFYAVICVTIYVLPRSRLVAGLLGLSLAAVLFRFAVVFLNPGATAPLVLLLPCRRSGQPPLGQSATSPPAKKASSRQGLALGALVVAAAAFAWFVAGGFGGGTRYVLPTYYLMLAVGSAAVLELAVTASSAGRWLFENAVLVRAGRLSYFVYLFHLPVAWMIYAGIFGEVPNLESGHALAIMAGVWAVLYGLAELSYRFLEAPLIRHAHGYFPGAVGKSD